MAGICPATDENRKKKCGVFGSPVYTDKECENLWRRQLNALYNRSRKQATEGSDSDTCNSGSKTGY